MTSLVGFRIEFYEDLSDDSDRGPLIGAVYTEDAFVVKGIPQKGDYIDVSYLVGGPKADAWWPGPVPFMTVHHLEHYPASVGGEKEPGVNVVTYAIAPGRWQAKKLVSYFRDAGWQIHVSDAGSPFGKQVRRTA